MNCLKCGRETPEDQVFCQECRLDMERYPVKPGTVVVLPKRRAPSAPRKPARRRGVSPEDQVRVLKKRVRLLAALLFAALCLIAALLYPASRYLLRPNVAPGQNYSSVVSTTAGTSPSAPPSTVP